MTSSPKKPASKSSIPTNKSELEASISIAFNKILADYSTIPNNVTRQLGVVGNVKGTEISVCDTLAYLIGWQKLVLKWVKLSNQSQTVDFPETGYKWNELGKLAQHFQFQYAQWSYKDLLEEFTVVSKEVLKLIASLSDHQLYGEPWYKKYTLGKMIQFNTTSPMVNIRSKVRKFKKQNQIN